jgi:hypothetical protein
MWHVDRASTDLTSDSIRPGSGGLLYTSWSPAKMEIAVSAVPHVTRGRRPAIPLAASERQEKKEVWNH